MVSEEELFKTITGCNFNDKIALGTLQESFKMKPHLVDRPGIELQYNFETAWEKSQVAASKPERVIEGFENVVAVDPPKA